MSARIRLRVGYQLLKSIKVLSGCKLTLDAWFWNNRKFSVYCKLLITSTIAWATAGAFTSSITRHSTSLRYSVFSKRNTCRYFFPDICASSTIQKIFPAIVFLISDCWLFQISSTIRRHWRSLGRKLDHTWKAAIHVTRLRDMSHSSYISTNRRWNWHCSPNICEMSADWAWVAPPEVCLHALKTFFNTISSFMLLICVEKK